MARSKAFFGLRRGSTKSHTYQVLRGQQVTKDRVTDVTNPQTRAQMVQRLTFAAAALFYKHAIRNFFKCAFEDKKHNESVYNAFMRHNVARAGAMSKYMIDNGQAAIGQWMVSSGRLGTYEPIAIGDTDDSYLSIGVVATEKPTSGRPLTIGQMSNALMAANPALEQGDVVTLVRIYGRGIGVNHNLNDAIEAESLLTIDDNITQPKWDILQERIDTTSNDPTTIFKLKNNGTDDELALTTPEGYDNVVASRLLYGTALVISRPLRDGRVYVSTSVMSGNTETLYAIAIGQSNTWKIWAAENYVALNASEIQDVILKGSIAAAKNNS